MTNAVFFEHTYYYDEKIIDLFLKRNGFKIKKNIYFNKKNSIFFINQKINKKYNLKYNNYKFNKNLFLNLQKIINNNTKKF